MHSATKFIGGHSDIMAGVLAVKGERSVISLSLPLLSVVASEKYFLWHLVSPDSTPPSLSLSLSLCVCVLAHAGSFAGPDCELISPSLSFSFCTKRQLDCSQGLAIGSAWFFPGVG